MFPELFERASGTSAKKEDSTHKKSTSTISNALKVPKKIFNDKRRTHPAIKVIAIFLIVGSVAELVNVYFPWSGVIAFIVDQYRIVVIVTSVLGNLLGAGILYFAWKNNNKGTH